MRRTDLCKPFCLAAALGAVESPPPVPLAVPADASEGSLLDFDIHAAANGACETVGVPVKDGFGDALAGDDHRRQFWG